MKEYKKLSRKQLKSYYADLYAANSGSAELQQLSVDRPDEAAELAEFLSLKPVFLEVSPIHLISAMLCLIGGAELPKFWLTEIDPQQAALDFFNDGGFDRALDAVGTDNQQIVVNMAMAVASNLQSIQVFGSSIFELLMLREDEDLFRAVLVDRSAVSAPVVQRRIQLAESQQDGQFFDKLAKALKKSRPSMPEASLNESRAVLYLLEDIGALEELTHSDVTRLLVDELEVYDDEGLKDPVAAVTKFVQRFKKARTPKP